MRYLSDELSVWHCPECGTPEYTWRFTTEDGRILLAKLSSIPDFSALEVAKKKAIQEDDEQRMIYNLKNDGNG